MTSLTILYYSMNTSLDVPQVIDMDSGQNAEVDFSLEAGPARQFFSLLHSDSSSTQLHLARELDRETQDFYSFRIFATDRGSPSSLIGQTEIFITVGVSWDDGTKLAPFIAKQLIVVHSSSPVQWLLTACIDGGMEETGGKCWSHQF